MLGFLVGISLLVSVETRQTPLRWLKLTLRTLRRWVSSSRSNSASEQARDLILASNPWFLGMENHLGPFPEASDGPEGQELPVWAVGGQGCGESE